jgi:hypothetical protein
VEKRRNNDQQPELPLQQKQSAKPRSPTVEAGPTRKRHRRLTSQTVSEKSEPPRFTAAKKKHSNSACIQKSEQRPISSPIRRQLLFNALMAGPGAGWRIPWLGQLATDSERHTWTADEINAAVADDIEWVSKERPFAPNSLDNLARDGRLAADPAVRKDFFRLCDIVDELVATQKDLVNDTVRRRYHALWGLMRLQRKPISRCHSASAAAYTAYLQEMLAVKLAKAESVAEPSVEQAPNGAPGPAGVSEPLSAAEQFGTAWAVLVYEADFHTIDALVRRSSSTGIPIQSLIDAAIQNFLR